MIHILKIDYNFFIRLAIARGLMNYAEATQGLSSGQSDSCCGMPAKDMVFNPILWVHLFAICQYAVKVKSDTLTCHGRILPNFTSLLYKNKTYPQQQHLSMPKYYKIVKTISKLNKASPKSPIANRRIDPS